MPDFVIKKSNGDKEFFDREKLIRSLRHAGASEEEIEQTVIYVLSKLKSNITTGDIYSLAYKNLNARKKNNPNAIRYSLKRSLMELGPTGFPFEKFVAKIFNQLGYECKTGVTIQGHCIDHEVDIFAYNSKEVICMEAKFHNEQHLKSDAKVALYVKARFDDLIGQEVKIGDALRKITKGILVTNTGFTDTVSQYVSCIGTFELMSWSEPRDKSILEYIEKYNLYPVGIIPELTKKEIDLLIEREILTCNDLKNNISSLNSIGIKGSKQAQIIETMDSICKC